MTSNRAVDSEGSALSVAIDDPIVEHGAMAPQRARALVSLSEGGS